jgi:hypothetical protein
MSVSFDGKKLVPAPLVTINKNYSQAGGGEKTGVSYDITVNGTLLPWRGSPSGDYSDLNDAFWTLGGYPPDETYDGSSGAAHDRILRKQEALRWLFKDDGKSFEWQPAGGQPVVKCNPKIISIDFPDGQWVDRSDYSVTLEANWIFIPVEGAEDSFDPQLLRGVSEDWSFSEVVGKEGNEYEVTHNISAQAVFGYDGDGNRYLSKEGWELAKDWVDARVNATIDGTIADAAIGSSSWIDGNYIKNVIISETEGTYNVVETWASMPSTTITQKEFSYTETKSGDITVTYTGTIKGISAGSKTGGQTAIDNAKAQVPSDSAARTEAANELGSFFPDEVLGEGPTQKSVATNESEGIVRFSFTWSAAEDSSYKMLCQATLNLDQNGKYTMGLTCDIEGKGATPTAALNNAKAAIPTDSAARDLADGLVGDQIPTGVTISSDIITKATLVNETNSSVRLSYTWQGADDDNNNADTLNTQITYPKQLSAQLQIPGRPGGPIIQDMNTISSQVVTTTLTSDNNTTKPDNATIIAQMNVAGGVQGSWLLDNDQESYDSITGRYSRTRTHIVN